MAKNSGKVFEEDAKASFPNSSLLIRLPDPPQAFTQRSDTRFSIKNPCDYICFDAKKHTLYCFELKSTKYTSMAFDDPYGNEKESKMIKRHQILSLKDFAEYDGVYPAFVFNFREVGEDKIQLTYIQHINDFLNMIKNINGKKSFNIMDLSLNGGVRISGDKKITRYRWDFEGFFDAQKLHIK